MRLFFRPEGGLPPNSRHITTPFEAGVERGGTGVEAHSVGDKHALVSHGQEIQKSNDTAL